MSVALWLPSVLKALLTALIVVGASTLAEVLGPFWGALVASLPVSAGPAYVFLALRHGEAFVAESALGSLAANAATGVLLIIYGCLGGRLALWRSLGAALLGWLGVVMVLQLVSVTLFSAVVLNLIIYGVGFGALRVAPVAGPAPRPVASLRWVDLAVRAVAVAAFVSLVVAVSAPLGPVATGVAAVFPVSLISLIVVVHLRLGGARSALLAAHALRPMLGFGAALLVLHLAVPVLRVGAGLLAGLLVSLAWSGLLLVARRRAGANA
jgi:hypothetical protein